MGGNVNTNTGSTTQNNWNFFFNFNIGGNQYVDANRALQTLNHCHIPDSVTYGGTRFNDTVPHAGCLPSPSPDLSGAPAGRGLRTGEQGWPENTVTTAGGYRIVVEGGTNWNIYAPGQNPGDKPHTRVWGDPHVDEKDGTRWDFTGTKGLDGQIGNDFVLPDGTRIFARTSSDQGHSVTTGLTIANGADLVEVNGVDGKPTVGQVRPEGYEWRAQHVAAAGDRASFYLRGDNEHVHWARERHGQNEGIITGARDVNGSYDQVVDPTLQASVAPELRPPPGSRAWGNAIRSQLDDAQAHWWTNNFGPQVGVWQATQGAYGIHADHIEGQFNSDLRDWFFGQYFNPVSLMRDLLMSDSQWQRDLRFGITSNMGYV
jgi:hypothetical protein